MTNTQMEEKTFSQDGFDLHYYVAGQPENELIIFLHPAFGDHNCFYKQIDFFAKDYHIITVDMPGHGKSHAKGPAVTVDMTSEIVAGIITVEGHQSGHIIGVSMGSLIAQDVAVRFPEKVKTVTVVGGYSIFGDNKEIQRAQSGEMVKWFFMVLFSMKRFRRYLARTTVIHPEEQEIFYQSAQNFTRGSFRVMTGMRNVLRSEDHTHQHPLLILTGDQDLPLVRNFADEWHAREPLSECYTIQNAGHCANMDNAEDFNSLLLKFISKHGES